MAKKQRLDRILSNMGYGTRRDIKSVIKKGTIRVDGVVVKDGSLHVDPSENVVEVEGKIVDYREYIYIMMNKPQGVISASFDPKVETVVDILDEGLRRFKPFPVGRLDKDTEGLLILTNDGKLTHELLAPKKHIPKTYFAKINGEADQEDIMAFKEGVVLEDGYKTLPGELRIIHSGPLSEIELTIYEGKFHQVKRMFQSRGKEVLYLKRVAMGPVPLDQTLALGEYRELTNDELNKLRNR